MVRGDKLHVVVQLIFILSLNLVLSVAIYNNKFQTKENKIETKSKIEPQQTSHVLQNRKCQFLAFDFGKNELGKRL